MMRTLFPVVVVGAVLAGSACRMDFDSQAYIEREEKRFTVEGAPQLDVKTFDGSIEIRSWDRPEVLVEVEKRGQDKDAVSTVSVVAEQSGPRITVDVRNSGRRAFVGIGRFTSTSARLIVSLPKSSSVTARSNDGSIVLERVDGKIDLRTDDGSIRVTETAGDVLAESGDGSLTLDDVSGHVEARTRDGSIRVSGKPGVLRLRSGDGSISLRIRDGAQMADDWTVTTGDGSVTAELPSGFSALVDADPGSDGRVRSELTLTNLSGPGTDNKRNRGAVTGQLGAGGKHLTLRTGDGTIRIASY